VNPYVEASTIPEGMTVAAYRNRRLPRSKPLPLHLAWFLLHHLGVRPEHAGGPARLQVRRGDLEGAKGKFEEVDPAKVGDVAER
jgi:hypothetical protein